VRAGEYQSRIERIVTDADISLVMTTAKFIPDVKEWLSSSAHSTIACVVSDQVESTTTETDHFKPSGDQLSFLQYTSGSTGNPKGVMVSHRNLMDNSALICKKCNHSENTVLGGWLPFYHDMGLIGLILQSLYVGGHLVMMAPMTFMKRPSNWLNAISRYRINTSGGPNSSFELCSKRVKHEEISGIDLSSLHTCFNGSEPVHQATMDLFAEHFEPYGFNKQSFFPCYGMAEATLMISSGVSGKAHRTLWIDQDRLANSQVVRCRPKSDGATEFASCGEADGQTLRVVDPNSKLDLGDERIGEIWVRSGSVAQGYWGDSTRTTEVFHATLAGTQDPHFLRTGDLGFIEQGQIFITGRLKDMIKINGRNLYPNDIERRAAEIVPHLSAHFRVAFGIADGIRESVALLQELSRSHDHGALPLADYADRLRNDLSAFTQASIGFIGFVPSGTIPRTTSGKVQRNKSKQLFLSGEFSLLYQDGMLSSTSKNTAGSASEAS